MYKNTAIQQASATLNNGTMNQWDFRFGRKLLMAFWLSVCNLIFYSRFGSGGSALCNDWLAVIVIFLYFCTVLSEAFFSKRQSLELKRLSAELGNYYL